MKVNLDATINDLDGKPVVTVPAVEKDGQTAKPAVLLRLKDICENALQTQFPDEHHLQGDEKNKRFKLLMRLHSNEGEIDLEPEDVTLLRLLVGKAYWHPLTVGRAYELLHG